ncbi:Predicted homoserine dehydrogenase, contains C-terminal SAF domain [Anaerosphaera aminiphila DSM 21120]|uniref:Predicted homoserine dehydrogenase, contains C-terminal SAF domain n=1 Tax=Anaerosphaera aminiphila DSM 21120 TaxID=1120995 RepID=A0A1M5QW69_9FIRM|nr:SAF domain-containing protein [Anaerosphaera aminiphila]SHH18126.1 Predicted homoserine dehydrogenase, contains C-terminal SAF domain [Anaerosphaera aminiphila DSM 21120]
MFYLKKSLEKHGEIKVGIVGAGIMGSSLVAQLELLDNFIPAVMSSRRLESVYSALDKAKVDRSKVIETNSIEEAKEAIDRGYYVATTNNKIAATVVDCVVDCTGNTEEGTKISLCAIENGVDIVTLNVEMDATVGCYLKVLADKKGVIYTGSAGDEPGAIIELYEFLNTVGFEILVLGKGKNNELNYYATPDELKEEALKKGLNPKMLTSFVDGTNTMTELNAVCNATGFLPDTRGCHGFISSPKTLAEDIKTKDEGGILNSYKTVDFVKGIAPGVFAIVKCKSDVLTSEMNYLKMGDGPNFAIYRPYHLTSIETPNSIIKAVVLRDSSIASIGKPVAETVAIAKKDLAIGESIDGIGGNTVYGVLESAEVQKSENLIPMGILVGNVRVRRNIKKGEALSYEDVELDESSEIVRIRREQENFFTLT